ncbi:MAG: rhodanese-like domain-containing protein [Bacteroidota bacterium]
MKTALFILPVFCFLTWGFFAQGKASLVDFDAYEKLVQEVKEHRKTRLVTLEEFLKMSKEANTVILDTRSDSMYLAKHIAGAIHLNFSDFTQANLAKIIPSSDTRILIYCNNNFEGDEIYLPTKSATPKMSISGKKALTLALNIPTYINLYGYGYKNVYELSELVSVYFDPTLFEGTAVE